MKSDFLTPMERALLPRSSEGLIDPMTFDNEAPKTQLFPCIRPSIAGTVTPMIFEEDFADGKLPENFGYALGHVRPGQEFNGTNWDAICYEDPVLNLSHRDQKLLLCARAGTAVRASMQSVPPVAQPLPDELLCSTGEVREGTDRLILMLPKGERALTNFLLRVGEYREILDEKNTGKAEILLSIWQDGKGYELTIDGDHLNDLLAAIQSILPSARIMANIKDGKQHLIGFVREQLRSCERIQVVRRIGFYRVNGVWAYAHDGAIPSSEKVRFDTGRRIPYNGMSPCEAFHHAVKVLELSPRMELMLPLFLLAHLGPLFKIFQTAGYQPRFVTFLAGETGSLKTSLALALFNLFAEKMQSPQATFKDTATALERKLGTADSSVLVIDDFCPAVTTDTGREMLSKLETVIRFVGDGIPKSRCTSGLNAAEEYPPTGCCLVTGEMTSGTQSSLLRCLILPISRNDIDGAKLTIFQQNPELLSTHFFHFLVWVGQNVDGLISTIQRNFCTERCIFSETVKEKRLVDAGATLLLTAEIVLRYASECCGMPCGDVEMHLAQWRESILSALRVSEQLSRELEPVALYVSAIFGLYDSGRIPLALNRGDYCPERHYGFVKDGCWWLRHDDLHVAVCRHLSSLHQPIPMKASDIRERLASNGLIQTETEIRNGMERSLLTCKSSLSGRPRFLVLRVDIARDYLENFN